MKMIFIIKKFEVEGVVVEVVEMVAVVNAGVMKGTIRKLNQSDLKEKHVFLSKEKNNWLNLRYNRLFYT